MIVSKIALIVNNPKSLLFTALKCVNVVLEV